MPTEQRVITPKKIGGGKIGAKKPLPEPEAPAEKPEKAKGGSKKKLIIIAAAVLVVVAAAAYFLVLAPKGDSSAADAPKKPVAIQQLDPHSLNLADGHYLRLGFALQLTKDTTVDAAGALDAAITVFSGHSMADIGDATTREQLRDELLSKLQERYGKDLVMGVEFTDYVTQ